MLINPIITEVSSKDKTKICNYNLNHEKLGELEIKTYSIEDNSEMFNIEVLDNDKFVIGREILEIDDKKSGIFGFNIEVDRQFRKNSLGEIMRLVSIIEMLENGKNEIEIVSMPSAIYFHSKYKFEPNIKMFSVRDEALLSCIKNQCKDMHQEQEEAVNLMTEIKGLRTAEEERNYCKIVSSFIKRYINKVLALPKERQVFYPFDYGFNMKLLKTTVQNNAKFINELYKKHGINYRI